MHRYKMYDAYEYPIIEAENFNQAQDRYKVLTGQKLYTPQSSVQPEYDSKVGSIESILEQDAHALLDKVVTTAFSIVYRIQIYNDVNRTIDYNKLKTGSQLRRLYDWIPGGNMNISRQQSMLVKELHSLDKQKLEEKVSAWKDMSQPINYFVELFHQSKELKQDKKLLG